MRPIHGSVALHTYYFNPRTHVGCDLSDLQSINLWKIFQSTHPRGVRRLSLSFCKSSKYFNPRTHVGCDLEFTLKSDKLTLFQSTHPRGVRLFVLRHPSNGGDFNPRTHVGCDKITSRTALLAFYFNPRTHVGCDELVAVYKQK